ncbi:MAG: non-canonical purine NTP pyrophosphatase [Myxococcota bacterium]
MAPRLLLCTSNTHKAQELSAMLGGAAEVVMPRDLGLVVDVPEDAETFEENALQKADRGYALSGMLTLADDSGLCVDALGGKPGVRSARFAADHGRGSGDAANNALMLERLRNVPDEKRGAHFVSVVAIVGPGIRTTFRGELHGRMGHELRGSHGFGYDPLFELPDGRALAMLPADEKNAISHRSRALAAARETLMRELGKS